MAVITYVDDRHKEREWTMAPPVAVLKSIDDYLAMPATGDVLIIHGGQRDARLAAASGRWLLLEAMVVSCQGGGRAILFSGGHPVIPAPVVREELDRAGLVEGEHYLLLTAMQNLLQEIDLELLKRTTITPGWAISSVKRRHAAPTLLSLSCLCQAALLTFDPDELDADAVGALGGIEHVRYVRSRVIPPPSQQMLSPRPWRASLGGSAGSVMTAIEREWPARGRAHDGTNRLVAALYDDSGTLDQRTISGAYVELQRALALNQEQQQ